MASAETFRAFGEKLRAARVEQRRSLEDVASAIKINRRHLEAIEAGNLGELPQGPYVAAFVREYARALGLPVPPEYAPLIASSAGSPRDPKVVSHPARHGNTANEEEGGSLEAISQVARETARLASTVARGAVKTVTKTTEGVVNLVETGSKEALEVLTSRELWEEAENIRRERHGLPPLERKRETETRRTEFPTSRSNEAAIAPESAKVVPETSAYASSDSSTPKFSRRTTNIVIATLVIIFGAVAFLAIRSARQQGGKDALAGRDYVPAPVENLPPPVKTKPQPSAPAQAALPIVAAVPAGDSLQFQVRATQPVWISIAPDGIPAYRGQMSAGEVRSFKAGQKFVIDIGNQKSVAMTFDGAPLSGLPAIQNSSVVVRNLVLTRNHASIAGNEVDLHTLTTPPSTPKPAVNIAPTVPLPPIAKKMQELAKNAHNASSQKSTSNQRSKQKSGTSQSTHVRNSSPQNAMKKSGKTTVPTEPIHPVKPIPPAP